MLPASGPVCRIALHTPYIRTKPFHKSQMVVEIDQDGNGIFEMEVILNYEQEKELLGFGEGIKVLAPQKLRDTIAKRLKTAVKNCAE